MFALHRGVAGRDGCGMTPHPPGRFARLRRALLLAVIAIIAIGFALVSLATSLVAGRR